MTNKAKQHTVEKAANILFTLCAIIAVFAVCSITVYMTAKGTPAFSNVGAKHFGNRLHPTLLTAYCT